MNVFWTGRTFTQGNGGTKGRQVNFTLPIPLGSCGSTDLDGLSYSSTSILNVPQINVSGINFLTGGGNAWTVNVEISLFPRFDATGCPSLSTTCTCQANPVAVGYRLKGGEPSPYS
jgi:hypothetical protein